MQVTTIVIAMPGAGKSTAAAELSGRFTTIDWERSNTALGTCPEQLEDYISLNQPDFVFTHPDQFDFDLVNDLPVRFLFILPRNEETERELTQRVLARDGASDFTELYQRSVHEWAENNFKLAKAFSKDCETWCIPHERNEYVLDIMDDFIAYHKTEFDQFYERAHLVVHAFPVEKSKDRTLSSLYNHRAAVQKLGDILVHLIEHRIRFHDYDKFCLSYDKSMHKMHARHHYNHVMSQVGGVDLVDIIENLLDVIATSAALGVWYPPTQDGAFYTNAIARTMNQLSHIVFKDRHTTWDLILEDTISKFK